MLEVGVLVKDNYKNTLTYKAHYSHQHITIAFKSLWFCGSLYLVMHVEYIVDEKCKYKKCERTCMKTDSFLIHN